VADFSPRIAWLPLLLLRGAWGEARALGEAARTAMQNAYWRPVIPSLLGQLARQQGERAIAWEYVGQVLPKGAVTDPGTTDFYYATFMQTLAARIALDGGDRENARAWIEAHDRWLAWNGTVLGGSEGQLL